MATSVEADDHVTFLSFIAAAAAAVTQTLWRAFLRLALHTFSMKPAITLSLIHLS